MRYIKEYLFKEASTLINICCIPIECYMVAVNSALGQVAIIFVL